MPPAEEPGVVLEDAVHRLVRAHDRVAGSRKQSTRIRFIDRESDQQPQWHPDPRLCEGHAQYPQRPALAVIAKLLPRRNPNRSIFLIVNALRSAT